MLDKECAKGSKNLINIFEWVKYKIAFMVSNNGYFLPDGLFVFCGAQGSGKTLSAVDYTIRLMKKYPLCKLCTNIYISDLPIVSYEKYLETNNIRACSLNHEKYLNETRVYPFTDNDDLMIYRNGVHGLIFLVDEISLYLNSLQSKNVNLEVMTEIAQLRKQRIHVVCTSQVFGRMAKQLREQFSNIIICKKYFGFIQNNRLIDRDSIDSDSSSDTSLRGKVVRRFIWFHSPKLYSKYDTYYKIAKGNFVDGGEKNDN